jgi:hypothetical protein
MPQEFGDAVQGLERSVRLIRHDLSCATNRLDVAFDEASAADGSPHPLKLEARLQSLEARLAQTAAAWAQTQEKRKEILASVIKTLVQNTENLARLSQLAGCCEPDYEEATSSYLAQLNASCSNGNTEPDAAPEPKESVETAPAAATQLAVAKSAAGAGATKGPDAAAFEALPVSVRGRVKFEAAETVFQTIVELFTQKNCKMMQGAQLHAVTLKELHEKGAIVHGRSGEQTLAALRVLGCVLVDKRGVSLPKPAKKPKAL